MQFCLGMFSIECPGVFPLNFASFSGYCVCKKPLGFPSGVFIKRSKNQRQKYRNTFFYYTEYYMQKFSWFGAKERKATKIVTYPLLWRASSNDLSWYLQRAALNRGWCTLNIFCRRVNFLANVESCRDSHDKHVNIFITWMFLSLITFYFRLLPAITFSKTKFIYVY